MDQSRVLGREHEFFGLMPMLAVEDVGATTAYFCDVLGFDLDFVVGEPPVHARIMKGDGSYGAPVYIHLMEVDEAGTLARLKTLPVELLVGAHGAYFNLKEKLPKLSAERVRRS